jgi:hypothetical protein
MSGPRLSIIPAGAVTDRSLEPRDLQVLCLLGRHLDKLGWCVRSQVKMAAELDCGRSSVQRSLDRLYEAGWVERKQRGAIVGEDDPGRPSMSHAYRVRLDRDDFAFESVTREASESHAENASQESDCPPVGTPSDDAESPPIAIENDPEGAREDGHPGAQPNAGTGAQPYMGTKNDPSERSSVERERDARARDRQARGLVDFEARWPTAAADDRQRTAYAWTELSDAEREAALAGIGPFLENLKRLGRKNVPAGWRYLEEKRWTLLEPEKPASQTFQTLAPNSAEAKAVEAAYALAGKSPLPNFMRSGDGAIRYRREITPQLLALAGAPSRTDWAQLTHQQAWAWNGLLESFVALDVWTKLQEGSLAPWPWPPRKDGTLCTGPPSNEAAA